MFNRRYGKMTGEEKERKKRDPIFTACLVIFVIACVGILGVYINDHYIAEDNTKVSYGDSVEVNYTGSFYDFVGGENAVVFDTSYSSVANDESIVKANDFTKKSSYSTLDFTVGNGSMLKMFEDAVVGHKVGDKVQVVIPVGDGYVGPESTEANLNGFTMPASQTMSADKFEELYPDVELKNGQSMIITSIYGWEATAQMTAAGNQVVLNYSPAVGQTYTYDADGDENFGKIEFRVTAVDDEITANISITETHVVDGSEIQMIKMVGFSESGAPQDWYITNVDSDSFTYKAAQNINQVLYFEIEIVSIS